LGTRPFTVSLRLRVALNRPPATELTLAGSVDQLIEQLHAYRQAGMNYAVLSFEADNQGEREQALTTFARRVAPALS
jgi:hypothetical protein